MRTAQQTPEQDTTGKWAAKFDTYNGTPGSEYLMSTVTSAFVFASEDDASAGGTRALDVLESTGRFPNLCVMF